jgi:hypothetical protein
MRQYARGDEYRHRSENAIGHVGRLLNRPGIFFAWMPRKLERQLISPARNTSRRPPLNPRHSQIISQARDPMLVPARNAQAQYKTCLRDRRAASHASSFSLSLFRTRSLSFSLPLSFAFGFNKRAFLPTPSLGSHSNVIAIYSANKAIAESTSRR